jgi:hypothetical protein
MHPSAAASLFGLEQRRPTSLPSVESDRGIGEGKCARVVDPELEHERRLSALA